MAYFPLPAKQEEEENFDRDIPKQVEPMGGAADQPGKEVTADSSGVLLDTVRVLDHLYLTEVVLLLTCMKHHSYMFLFPAFGSERNLLLIDAFPITRTDESTRDEELTHGVQTTHSGVIPILESQPPGPNYVECDDIHNIISYNISMII